MNQDNNSNVVNVTDESDRNKEIIEKDNVNIVTQEERLQQKFELLSDKVSSPELKEVLRRGYDYSKIIRNIVYIAMGTFVSLISYSALGSNPPPISYMILAFLVISIAIVILNVAKLIKNIKDIFGSSSSETENTVISDKNIRSVKKVSANILRIGFYGFIIIILAFVLLNSINNWDNGGNQLFIMIIIMIMIFVVFVRHKRK